MGEAKTFQNSMGRAGRDLSEKRKKRSAQFAVEGKRAEKRKLSKAKKT